MTAAGIYQMAKAEDVPTSLDKLAEGGVGRLYTLKAMVELGKGWHDCSKVAGYIWTILQRDDPADRDNTCML